MESFSKQKGTVEENTKLLKQAEISNAVFEIHVDPPEKDKDGKDIPPEKNKDDKGIPGEYQKIVKGEEWPEKVYDIEYDQANRGKGKWDMIKGTFSKRHAQFIVLPYTQKATEDAEAPKRTIFVAFEYNAAKALHDKGKLPQKIDINNLHAHHPVEMVASESGTVSCAYYFGYLGAFTNFIGKNKGGDSENVIQDVFLCYKPVAMNVYQKRLAAAIRETKKEFIVKRRSTMRKIFETMKDNAGVAGKNGVLKVKEMMANTFDKMKEGELTTADQWKEHFTVCNSMEKLKEYIEKLEGELKEKSKEYLAEFEKIRTEYGLKEVEFMNDLYTLGKEKSNELRKKLVAAAEALITKDDGELSSCFLQDSVEWLKDEAFQSDIVTDALTWMGENAHLLVDVASELSELASFVPGGGLAVKTLTAQAGKIFGDYFRLIGDTSQLLRLKPDAKDEDSYNFGQVSGVDFPIEAGDLAWLFPEEELAPDVRPEDKYVSLPTIPQPIRMSIVLETENFNKEETIRSMKDWLKLNAQGPGGAWHRLRDMTQEEKEENKQKAAKRIREEEREKAARPIYSKPSFVVTKKSIDLDLSDRNSLMRSEYNPPAYHTGYASRVNHLHGSSLAGRNHRSNSSPHYESDAPSGDFNDKYQRIKALEDQVENMGMILARVEQSMEAHTIRSRGRFTRFQTEMMDTQTRNVSRRPWSRSVDPNETHYI
mmetsp:Transcript_10542/g.15506  ORF Transcript_10542/g.15506 Transcript_10542/m.15506 type:complete len:709 (-) Transcript_10542:329-2455(-)